MTKHEMEARIRFEGRIAKESSLPYFDAVAKAKLLCRHGATYSRLQEANCNGVGTYYNEDPKRFAARQERFEKALEHREELLEKRIRVIVAELGAGFTVRFEGDPRGHTIKIILPSIAALGGEQEGYGVPTS